MLAQKHLKVEAMTIDAIPPVGTPAYDEWALDEALDETFPASDATVPTQPGSSVALRHAGDSGPDATGQTAAAQGS